MSGKPMHDLQKRVRPSSASQRLHEQGGFTLLELLLYMGLLITLVVAVTNIFIPLARGRGNVIARTDVHASMNFVVERLAQDIREATSISVPAATGDASSTANLILVHPVDGTVEWCVFTDQLRRAASGATCNGAIDPLTPATVIVATPTFTRWENTNTDLSVKIVSIEFDLTMSYNSTSSDYQYSESKTTTVSARENLF